MTRAAEADAFTFYALAISSFLESTVETYVDNLEPFFQCDAATQAWLIDTWLPEEAEHGRLVRAYVEATWPDFQWEACYAAFVARYAPLCAHDRLRASPALEALARCVTETQATMIYRCIARHTADPALRQLMARLSKDEVRHYAYFRDLHHRYDAIERNGLLRKLGTMVGRSKVVREEDLALAFAPLNAAWSAPPPFTIASYHGFLGQAAGVMRQHFPFEEGQRMLVRPLRSGRWFDDLVADGLGAVVKRQFLRFAG